MNKDQLVNEHYTACPRLATRLRAVRRKFPVFHAAPVARPGVKWPPRRREHASQ